MKAEIKELNKKLKSAGMLEMEIVAPKDLKAQRKNARYFEAEKFNQLVKNVKDSQALESIPLVHKKNGHYEIISGHHRIEAAKEAGLKQILVMVGEGYDRDDVISKQLAHNELAGRDDDVLLYELFQEIENVSKKIATGLSDRIDQIQYTSLNFRVGEWKEFTVLFLPEDIGIVDEKIEEIVEITSIKSQSEVRLDYIKHFDRFAKAVRKIKMAENIKSNGTALLRLVELAEETMMNRAESGNVQ